MTGNEKLSKAIQAGQVAQVKSLLSPSKFLWTTRPPQADACGEEGYGAPPLFVAFEEFHKSLLGIDEDPRYRARNNAAKDIIKFLVDEGADVNAVNQEGHSLLAVAVKQLCVPSVKLLLQLGAKVIPETGPSPIALAYHGTIKRYMIAMPEGVESHIKATNQRILDILLGTPEGQAYLESKRSKD